jgi:hypothetical protein
MSPASLRRRLLLMIALVIVQAGLGMAVNLYVSVPRAHPGAKPGNFLAGSLSSIGWAISHSPLALAIHAVLGIALVATALLLAVSAARLRQAVVAGCAITAARLRQAVVAGCAITAAMLLIGAGFNGASFLDFGHDINSLIMALLAFAALLLYAVALYLVPAGRLDSCSINERSPDGRRDLV